MAVPKRHGLRIYDVLAEMRGAPSPVMADAVEAIVVTEMADWDGRLHVYVDEAGELVCRAVEGALVIEPRTSNEVRISIRRL